MGALRSTVSANAPQVLELVANLRTATRRTQSPRADRNPLLDVVGAEVLLGGRIPVRDRADREDDRSSVTVALAVQLSGEVPEFNRTAGDGKTKPPAPRRQILLDGVGNDLHQRLVGLSGSDLLSLQQLDSQARESLKRPGDAQGRVHLDQHVLRRVDVNEELPRLVERAVQQGHQALMRDVWADVRKVAPVLGHQSLVLVTVEQLDGSLAGLHAFERAFFEDDHDASGAHPLLDRLRQKLVRLGGPIDFLLQALLALLRFLHKPVGSIPAPFFRLPQDHRAACPPTQRWPMEHAPTGWNQPPTSRAAQYELT
mmetsp:Transcript_81348/g.226547  ORF Transcript_81348/g.226547 Transcript_81348/m.226547 type:complete len:313 (-) Transcript_81348:18-956(-)